MSLLRLTALPANEGDCLILEYGDPARPQRLLIDGGRRQTYEKHLKPYLAALPEADRRLDLLVVTHIDRDHIEGALALAEDLAFPVAVDDIWFNTYQHLADGSINVLGAAQGERFTAAIRARKIWPWNKAFDGNAVSLGDGMAPVVKRLPLGASIRLLSPDRKKLAALRPVWKAECQRIGLVPGALATMRPGGLRGQLPVLKPRTETDLAALAARATPVDTAEPNGSSIAFVFEYDGRAILFAADAHPDLLLASVRKAGDRGRLKLDLVKLSHHGSRGNTTAALCAALDCRDVLVSTSGAIFAHPDQEAIARIITSGPARNIHFNYRSPVTQSWHEPALIEKYGYTPTYPTEAADGHCVLEVGGGRVGRIG